MHPCTKSIFVTIVSQSTSNIYSGILTDTNIRSLYVLLNPQASPLYNIPPAAIASANKLVHEAQLMTVKEEKNREAHHKPTPPSRRCISSNDVDAVLSSVNEYDTAFDFEYVHIN